MSEDAGVVTTLDVATQQLVETPVAPQSASETAQKPTNSGTSNPTPVDGGGEESQPKAKNSYARRIDELTREREQANRRADEALAMARQALAERQRENAKPVEQAPQQPEKFIPHPNAPKRESYETFEDFVRAEARFYTRLDAQQEQERHQRAAQEQHQKQQVYAQTAQVVNTYLDRVDSFKANTPDYEEVVSNLDDIPLTPRQAAMTEAILRREDSGQILYHLGQNPTHAKQIAQMHPALQAAAIGEIGARLQAPSQLTNAPTPAQPSRAGRASATDAYRDEMTVEEYLAWKKRRGIK